MGPARRSLTSDYDREKLTNWKLRQLVLSKGRFPYRGGGFCVVAAESRCRPIEADQDG